MILRLTNYDCPTIVDDEDYFLLALWKYKWRIKWSSRKDNIYVVCDKGPRWNRKTIYLHRLITQVKNRNMEVHHKDRNILNNQRSNLEVLTRQEHMRRHIEEDRGVKDEVPF